MNGTKRNLATGPEATRGDGTSVPGAMGLSAAVFWAAFNAVAWGQPIGAGESAGAQAEYRITESPESPREQERRIAIARQRAMIDEARFFQGLPPRQVYDVLRGQVAAGAAPRSVLPPGGSAWPQQGGWFDPTWLGLGPPGLGPRLPTPREIPVRQPVGHEMLPNGKGGYVYRPVYETPEEESRRLEEIAQQRQALLEAAEDAAYRDGLARAAAYFREEQYHEAIDELRLLETRDERHEGTTLLLRGHAEFARGDFAAAADSLAAGMGLLGPAHWDLWVTRQHELYPDRQTFFRQLRRLEQHAQQRPTDPAGHFVLAFFYGYLGHPEAAIKQLDAVRHAPRLAERALDLMEIFMQRTIAQRGQQPGASAPAAPARKRPQAPAPEEVGEGVEL